MWLFSSFLSDDDPSNETAFSPSFFFSSTAYKEKRFRLTSSVFSYFWGHVYGENVIEARERGGDFSLLIYRCYTFNRILVYVS